MTTERRSTSGRHGKPEGLALSAFEERWWVQGSLFPPDLIEATLRVGYSAELSHLQVQIEVFDPETKELLAMRSVPHIAVFNREQMQTAALKELGRLLQAVLDPDPF